MKVRSLGREDKAKQPSRAQNCPCTCCNLTLQESYDPLFSHNQCFILNLQGSQVLVLWISYHLTWCKAYSYLQKMSFDVVPFFSCVADVGGGSSFRSHTDVVIVYCAQSAAGGSFAGLKKEQPVYVLLHEVQLWETKDCSCAFFFFFGRMWHRFFSNRILLQGLWDLQSWVPRWCSQQCHCIPSSNKTEMA